MSKAKNESAQTRELCAELQKLGAMIYPLHGGKYSPAGWPDRYFHSTIWCGFVEFKDEAKPLDTAQRLTIRDMNRIAPGSVWIARHGFNTIENESGDVLGRWTGDADFLPLLATLTQNEKQRANR